MIFCGVRSRTVTLKQVVPQGSLLSPLLFLFYVDDLASAVESPQVSIFADDVAVLTQDTNFLESDIHTTEGTRCCKKLEHVMENGAVSPKIRVLFSTTNTHEAKWRPSQYLSRQQTKHNSNTKFLGTHTIDRSPLFCMRPLLTAK